MDVSMLMFTSTVFAEQKDKSCTAMQLGELREIAANVKVTYVPKTIVIDTPTDVETGATSYTAKYIDIKVPNEIILVMYRFVAITEKPHCGINPSNDPSIGPYFFDLVIVFLFFLFNLCSVNSISTNAMNRKGSNFSVSNIVSCIISNIFSPPD